MNRKQSLILPMFPLGMVAFPGENLNLHIFEPRYKQLMTECEAIGQTFGIPAFIEKKLMPIGTEMELLAIEKIYDNGEMDVKTRGIGLFQINDFFPKYNEKLYAAAEVHRIDFDTESNLIVNQKLYEYVYELFDVLSISKPLPKLDEHFNTYMIAHQVGFNIEQEYEFLQITLEGDRQLFMMSHLERLIPLVREMHRLQERAKLNGHFKHLGGADFS
jgi:ATP-dependent Lon protease